MHSNLVLTFAALAPLAAAEEVLGVYIFHRHGDRTAKAWTPVNLTALGADQVHSSGSFYRSRYVDPSSSSSSDLKVAGLSQDTAVISQLAISSPPDAVLASSAISFVQGLYPPVGGQGQLLANGSHVQGPLNGYQYVPIAGVDNNKSPDHPESNEWLQGGSGCTKAVVSSNNYFSSTEYFKTANDTKSFYQSLLPAINSTYAGDQASFKNAYTIFDYLNVASIHNTSIPSANLLTKSTKEQLFDLASTHEWNLAYNSSEPVRAIAGSVLAGQIVQSLDDLVSKKKGTPKFNVQFGAYGTFMAFFGLANLQKASEDFYGIVNYASSMAFELVSNVTDPKPEDVSVRFLFVNGTAADNELKAFPLFGQDKTTLPWADFKDGMNKFAIADTQHWCTLCGNTDGECASDSASDGGDASANSSGSGGGNGVSKPVAGVIGALVTLVVILGIQAAVILLGGLRLVKKSTLARGSQVPESAVKK